MIRAENEITLTRVDDGSDGNDGYSPTATVTKSGDTATITITDKNGTTTETVSDGQDGAQGISVTGVSTQYYLSTSFEETTGGEWSDEQPGFETGLYYWTRDKITYSNSTTSYSTPVYAQGLTLANEYALDANEQAVSAYNSASQAINQLSVVEDIVGVLNLIAENGTYENTADIEPLENKWYFTRSGSGTSASPYKYELEPNVLFEFFLTQDVSIDPNKTYYRRSGSGTEEDPYYYTIEDEPVLADLPTYYENTNQNYYELVGAGEAIQNYVSSHLALDSQGLNLQNGSTRLLLSTTDGLVLFDQNGDRIASYGSEVEIGGGDYKVKLTPTAMIFEENNVNVASISGKELVINEARVNNSMRMGNFVWTINTDGRLILKYSAEQ